MGLFNENVLPGETGKKFRTDAKEPQDLEKIAERVLEIDGVHDVGINTEVFPVEFTIHANDFSIVSIKDIEDAARKSGFHLIPKSKF